MSKITVYKNKYTGELVRILLKENIPGVTDDGGNPITVYELSNNTRWGANDFFNHWTCLGEFAEMPKVKE